MNSILWIFCQNVLCTAWDGFSVKSAENWEVCLKWTCTSRWIGQNHDSIETLNFVDLSKSSSHRNPNENFCMEKHLIVWVLSLNPLQNPFGHVYLSNYSGMSNSILTPISIQKFLKINTICWQKQHLNVIAMIDSPNRIFVFLLVCLLFN